MIAYFSSSLSLLLLCSFFFFTMSRVVGCVFIRKSRSAGS
ncbi:putative signal peptide protein [Puccinia sorghi]|uniref:Putative signal peptide protein n=1 Tax=Puccinia sorghi TaxID=27349 RepID=A0A0L6UTD5_9BASI|nr:putative signal peptide protein [Puccinia sorghi]